MRWKINEGFHSKMSHVHLEKKYLKDNISKVHIHCHHYYSGQQIQICRNFPYWIFPFSRISVTLFPHGVCIIFGTKLFRYMDLSIYFIHSFLAVHLSLMLCLKLCFQHLSSITWQKTKKKKIAHSIQDQCCIVSTLEYQT